VDAWEAEDGKALPEQHKRRADAVPIACLASADLVCCQIRHFCLRSVGESLLLVSTVDSSVVSLPGLQDSFDHRRHGNAASDGKQPTTLSKRVHGRLWESSAPPVMR